MHDYRRGREIEALRKGRRRDRHLENTITQQALDLFAVGRWKGTVVQGDTQAQAFKNCAVRSEPLLAKRDGSAEDRGLGFEQRP